MGESAGAHAELACGPSREALRRSSWVLGRGDDVRASSRTDRGALAGALRARGHRPGGHLALLMENNRPFLEVLWAAQRSGLHYTASTGTSGRPRCSTSSTTAERRSRHVRGDGARSSARSTSSVSTPRSARSATSTGFERYDDVLAAHRPNRPVDEQEGREMLYSSGTTGRPKGVRKALPGTSFGDPIVGAGADRPGHRDASAAARARCTSPPRRSTTPRRSCTRCRCSASGPPSW